MRKRLRKKKDKQEVLASIDWWNTDNTDTINEYIDKTRGFGERWTKRISLVQPKQA